MKIFVFNPNVGSAIEYMGDTLVSWLKEIGEVHDCKHQTRTSHYVKFLYEYSPDAVVTNEFYHRAICAANIYKYVTDVPFIHVDHVWKRLNAFRKGIKEEQEYEALKEVREVADWIFCVNHKPEYESWHKRVAHKISNRYYATNPDVFKVMTPWEDRLMFGYFGNILPHKLSLEFLQKLVGTDLVIDCYGKKNKSCSKEYLRAFDKATESGNIRYFGLVPQEEVPWIMNKYGYLVMPHDGYEPFNWVVKQCLHCGTIPLIVNDRDSNRFDGKWLDWANGMYMGCPDVDSFISNLEQLSDERPDHSGISEYITYEVRRRFPYQEFKEEFQNKVRELCNG